MWMRWLVALLVGFVLLMGQIAPGLAGFESGSSPPGQDRHQDSQNK